jgi:hypothetical protein
VSASTHRLAQHEPSNAVCVSIFIEIPAAQNGHFPSQISPKIANSAPQVSRWKWVFRQSLALTNRKALTNIHFEQYV